MANKWEVAFAQDDVETEDAFLADLAVGAGALIIRGGPVFGCGRC
jgi:enolase